MTATRDREGQGRRPWIPPEASPLDNVDRRLAGAITGSVLAGLCLTVLLIVGERKAGLPSELVLLGRAGARRLDLHVPSDTELPGPVEQVLVQGGHLVLSAAGGATYALCTDRTTRVVPGGLAFGISFYAAMHWIAGPLLGLKDPEWRSDAKTIVLHTLNHIGFGLVTAAFAKLAACRSEAWPSSAAQPKPPLVI